MMQASLPETALGYAEDIDRWVEIYLDAISDNLTQARKMMKPECRLLAVVKADAYGLGAVQVARVLAGQTDILGVTTVEEGIELRQNGIMVPVLVFTPVNRFNAHDLRQYQLIATVDSKESIEIMAASGIEPHPCHLKVNMGMNRLGCSTSEAEDLLIEMNQQSSIETAGIYGHLANAKSKFAFSAKKSINEFSKLVNGLDEKGIKRGLAHIANSSAFLRFPESHLDMVRLGTLLYGQAAVKLPAGMSLKNPFKAYARVIAVREVKYGDAIGYGGDRRVRQRQQIAIISIGFADGFAMEPLVRDDGLTGIIRQAVQKTARIIVKRPLHYAVWQGHRLRLIGRVGMQLSAIRTEGYSLQVGDAVEIKLFRISAASRLRRYYFDKGLMIDARSIIESKGYAYGENMAADPDK